MQNISFQSNNGEINQALSDKYFKTWMTIQRVRHAIYRIREQELEPYGVSVEQAAILNVVGILGNNSTPSEIARWTFRKPHTITVMVNKMIKCGLLKKSKDLPVKNMVRVSLTELGKQAYLGTQKRESVYKVMSALTEDQCDELRSNLEIVLKQARLELEKAKILPNLPSPDRFFEIP